MSKKILSIALAVVMLFSVLAFSASAANTNVDTTFPGEGHCGFRVVSNAYVGMPKGEEVTVKVYWVLPVGTDYSTWKMSAGNVVLAYDSSAYTLNTENPTHSSLAYDARTWGDSYVDYLKATAGVNCGTTTVSNIISALTEDEKALNWDSAAAVQIAVDTAATTTQKGFPIDADCEAFSLSFTTADVIEADDVIGIPSATLGGRTKQSYSTSANKEVKYGTKLVNSEWAEPAVVSVNDTATVKMRPGSADGKVDLGLTGTVLKASFNAGKEWGAGCYVAPNLNAVGVQVRVNGVVQAAESTCIYELKDGREGFNYRAVIADMNVAELGAQIEVRTYITDVNNNIYFSNWMFIDAADAYEAKFGA